MELQIMDSDLWGPPYDPDGSCVDSISEWHCDFYFGYGFDEIEENALNEKFCIQVLRILIRKADDEFDELEQHLVSLQSQLTCIEDEDWFEICCNALKEKIDLLDVSVQSLRNKDKDDIEVHLLMHTKPVETLHELLKTLLRNYSDKKDDQPKDVKDAAILDSCLDASQYAANILDENQILSDCNSKLTVCIKESITNAAENSAALNPSLNLQEKETRIPKFDKLANSDGNSDSKKLSSNSGPKSTQKEEAGHHASNDNGKIKKSSPKSADKRIHIIETVKDQSKINGENGSIGCSNKKRKLNFESEVVDEHSLISTTDFATKGSSLKPVMKKTDIGKHIKAAGAIAKNIGALRCAAALSGKRNSDSGSGTLKQKKSSNSDIDLQLCDCSLKSVRKQTMKEPKISATDNLVSWSLSQKAEGKKKNTFQTVHGGEMDCTDTESSVCTSLAEMQDQKGKMPAELQPQKGKLVPEVEMTELEVDAKRSTNLSASPQKEKAKKNIESNPSVLQEIEIGFSIREVSSSSSISKCSKQKKFEVGLLKTSLDQSFNGKIGRKVIQAGESESIVHDAVPNDSPNSVSHVQKKGKKNADLQLAAEEVLNFQMDVSSYHKGTTRRVSRDDLSVTDSSSIVDSSSEAVASLPSPINLDKSTLTELHAIAKQHKLTKYSKLKKCELLEKLVNHFRNC